MATITENIHGGESQNTKRAADGGTVRDLVKAKQNSVEAQNYRSVMPWKAGGGGKGE